MSIRKLLWFLRASQIREFNYSVHANIPSGTIEKTMADFGSHTCFEEHFMDWYVDLGCTRMA